MADMSGDEAVKERIREQWDEAAARWERWTPVMRRQFAPATELMLDLAHLNVGDHVLDIAAGNGNQSIAAARRVGPSGHVLAIDLAAEQLKYAAAAAREVGVEHVETRVMDAEDLELPDASFDAVICHFGVLFFPDPDQGLREMRRVLKPGARASMVIYAAGGSPESDLAASIVRDRLGPQAQTPERLTGGSLGDRGVLKRKLEGAGFSAVEEHELDVPIRLRSASEAVQFLQETYPTLAEMVARLTPDQRDDVWQRIHSALGQYVGADGFVCPNRVVVVAGARPEAD